MSTPKQNLAALVALIHAQHLCDDARRVFDLADEAWTADHYAVSGDAHDKKETAWAHVLACSTHYGRVYWQTCHDLGLGHEQVTGAVLALDVADGYAKGAAERRAKKS